MGNKPALHLLQTQPCVVGQVTAAKIPFLANPVRTLLWGCLLAMSGNSARTAWGPDVPRCKAHGSSQVRTIKYVQESTSSESAEATTGLHPRGVRH